MKKVAILLILCILIVCLCTFTACNFAKGGVITKKYYSATDYRIDIIDSTGLLCTYTTDSYETWEAVNVGDEFFYVIFGNWKPSANTIYIGDNLPLGFIEG